jgi:Na+/alanine symporter
MQHNFPLTPLDIVAIIASISAVIKFGSLFIAIAFFLYGFSFSLGYFLYGLRSNNQ